MINIHYPITAHRQKDSFSGFFFRILRASVNKCQDKANRWGGAGPGQQRLTPGSKVTRVVITWCPASHLICPLAALSIAPNLSPINYHSNPIIAFNALDCNSIKSVVVNKTGRCHGNPWLRDHLTLVQRCQSRIFHVENNCVLAATEMQSDYDVITGILFAGFSVQDSLAARGFIQLIH